MFTYHLSNNIYRVYLSFNTQATFLFRLNRKTSPILYFKKIFDRFLPKKLLLTIYKVIQSDKRTADSGIADGDFDGRAQLMHQVRQYKISKARMRLDFCAGVGALTSKD